MKYNWILLLLLAFGCTITGEETAYEKQKKAEKLERERAAKAAEKRTLKAKVTLAGKTQVSPFAANRNFFEYPLTGPVKMIEEYTYRGKDRGLRFDTSEIRHQYTFDTNGRLTEHLNLYGETLRSTETFWYDEFGLLERWKEVRTDGSITKDFLVDIQAHGPEGCWFVTYSHEKPRGRLLCLDDQLRLASIKNFRSADTTGAFVVQQFRHDRENRVREIIVSDTAGHVLNRVAFTYEEGPFPIEEAIYGSGDNPEKAPYTFTLDNQGNWIKMVTLGYNRRGQLESKTTMRRIVYY